MPRLATGSQAPRGGARDRTDPALTSSPHARIMPHAVGAV